MTGAHNRLLGGSGRHRAPRPRRAARRAVVVGAGAIAVATATPAFAFYTGGGTATGGTKLSNSTVFATTGTATGLYPGGAFDVTLIVNNTGNPHLTLQSVMLDTGPIVITNAPGCTAPAVSIAFSGSLAIPANTSTTITLPHAATMGTTSQNACQGGTFKIPVTLTAVQ
jgi:hypothetical protein